MTINSDHIDRFETAENMVETLRHALREVMADAGHRAMSDTTVTLCRCALADCATEYPERKTSR